MTQVFILTGPSGVGKDTLIDFSPENVLIGVSHTTRDMRPGEVDGETYYFALDHEFEAMLARNEFIEADRHFNAWYGFAWSELTEVAAAGKDLIVILDPNGTKQALKRLDDRGCSKPVTIFLLPENGKGQLARQMRYRGDSEAKIAERLVRVDYEMSFVSRYDHVVVNREGDVDYAAKALTRIIENTAKDAA